ncbi:MAG TPA: GGDEF domain-containing protein [Solirubrobacteraceae bacterium]|nr:GGDEF domain-containing protein [Solirubrobacteraceae bacterium]HTX08013.1 GGDEF domain-containing protein [Solirubrobacteraceae bacterium]
MALAVAWLLIIAAGGWALATSQSSSRHAVAARVQSRTEYSASFISIYARDLLARDRAAAQAWLSSPKVGPAALEKTSAALGLRTAAVSNAARHSEAAPSSIRLTEAGGVPVIEFTVGYRTPTGERVFTGEYPVRSTVLPTVLGHIFAMPGWRSYLIDFKGGRLTAGPGSRQGHPVRFSAAVAGTDWRIVVTDPAGDLYGFLDGTGRWIPWLALAGLAVAGLAVIFLFARLQRHRAQLSGLNDELARLAAVDPLTGLRNRRAIEQHLSDSLSAARRHGLDLSLLIIDVDRFKTFNDTLGHQQGDAILAHAARVLDAALRAEDAIGRWGGEEFLVVLPGTDEEGALHLTERLRAALADDQPESARAHQLPVTITIGLAEWGNESIGELISRADSALYLGKGAGRDTVHVSRDRPAVA